VWEKIKNALCGIGKMLWGKKNRKRVEKAPKIACSGKKICFEQVFPVENGCGKKC
jgi:hypothetical protein